MGLCGAIFELYKLYIRHFRHFTWGNKVISYG